MTGEPGEAKADEKTKGNEEEKPSLIRVLKMNRTKSERSIFARFV